MSSLRGPLARCNRERFPDGNGTDTPVTYEPTDIRYPCNAKRWKLGVGWSSGALETEGVFAIGKDTEDVVFKAGQLICPFRGHQQSKRPRQVNNHAWAHNGIREGTPGCIYINAFNNQESPTRWFRMAGHEDLANCRIRSMPRQQGGGLGIYALEDIWNRQELLLANREYPTSESAEITADALAPATETLEENRTDADDPAKDAGDAAEAQGETLGHQYATCDDTGGWRMHEPSQPWTDGILVQQRTPSPVDNIPRWTSLTDEYRQVEIPIAEATALRKDLWLTSLNCGSLSAANSHKQINKAKLTSICWQFQRCGSDVMYLTDTRLNQVQGQRAIEFMRTLLPHGTFIRQSAVGMSKSLPATQRKKHWSKGTQTPTEAEPGTSGTTHPSGRIGGMILIVSNKWSKHIKDWWKDPSGAGVVSSVTIKAMSQDITILGTYWPLMRAGAQTSEAAGSL
jgi:hypothetical protein